jgi:flagellin-specific chaperone FliS
MDRKIAKINMIEEFGETDSEASIYKQKISEYEVEHETEIPMLFNALLRAVENNASFTTSEGIFRKACDIKKLTMLETELRSCTLPQ